MTDDNVNHPSHYNQYTGFEVIDVCEQLVGPDGKAGFNLGNAFKYIARAGWKNPNKHVQDLEKAKFYLQREIDRIQNLNILDSKKDLPSEGNITSLCCPQCSLTLKETYECPRNHGWMSIESGDHVWMPMSVAYKNPKKYTAAQSVDRTIYKTSHPLCATCDFEMRLSAKQANDGTQYYECEAGHGSVRLPVPPKNFVIGDKVTSLGYLPEADAPGPKPNEAGNVPYCPVDECNALVAPIHPWQDNSGYRCTKHGFLCLWRPSKTQPATVAPRVEPINAPH